MGFFRKLLEMAGMIAMAVANLLIASARPCQAMLGPLREVVSGQQCLKLGIHPLKRFDIAG